LSYESKSQHFVRLLADVPAKSYKLPSHPMRGRLAKLNDNGTSKTT
jgi:hypothetical protein